jgi:tRNA dimethylallyltransferase
MLSKKKLIVIMGPTATGKTDLGITIAKKFNGEIISCDSRQLYKGLDIGTGKLPSMNSSVSFQKFEGYWVIDGIKVWMLDVVEAKDRYDISLFITQANSAIENILDQQKMPILVGGTGHYIRGLLEGIPNLIIPIDNKLREKLEKLSLYELQKRLKNISSERWEKLNDSDKFNKRRLIRAIELITLYPYIEDISNSVRHMPSFDSLKIGITASREVLYKNIDLRVLSRLEGMIEEASKLNKEGLSFERMRELGLEYGMLADLLESKISRDDFIKTLQIKIHQYAKRQMTWFKKEKDVSWFDITDVGFEEKVEKKIVDWYNGADVKAG